MINFLLLFYQLPAVVSSWFQQGICIRRKPKWCPTGQRNCKWGGRWRQETSESPTTRSFSSMLTRLKHQNLSRWQDIRMWVDIVIKFWGLCLVHKYNKYTEFQWGAEPPCHLRTYWCSQACQFAIVEIPQTGPEGEEIVGESGHGRHKRVCCRWLVRLVI